MLCGGCVELTGETGPNYHKIYENYQPREPYAVPHSHWTISVGRLTLEEGILSFIYS